MRSALFVPGARPDRFAKALASGADLVVIDLEDAVAAEDKAEARRIVANYCREGDLGRVAVRVNAMTTRDGLEDLLALADAPPPVLFVPKVERAGLLAAAHGVLPHATLAPLIESPAGLAEADAIASAPGVGAIMLGGVDYAAELGVAPSWDALFLARATIAGACARAGVAALDVPSLDLAGGTPVEDEARRVRALGMTGKTAIHPAQIAAIHATFSPSGDEVAEARAGLAAFRAAGGGVARFHGKLLEAPVVRRYARVLAQAGESVDA